MTTTNEHYLIRCKDHREPPFLSTYHKLIDLINQDYVCELDGVTTWGEFMDTADVGDKFETELHIIEKL